MIKLNTQRGRLRQMVDEISTASVLLGLSQTSDENTSTESRKESLDSSRQSAQTLLHESDLVCSNEQGYSNEQEDQQPNKRVRRQGRYSPQEREIIR